jgi:hypothetical protein
MCRILDDICIQQAVQVHDQLQFEFGCIQTSLIVFWMYNFKYYITQTWDLSILDVPTEACGAPKHQREIEVRIQTLGYQISKLSKLLL